MNQKGGLHQNSGTPHWGGGVLLVKKMLTIASAILPTKLTGALPLLSQNVTRSLGC